jgi:hypothetical protein
MRKGTPREILRHLNRPRETRIAELEASIRRDAEKLAAIATDKRITFFWQQMTNLLRDKGALLTGDGRGGFLPKKISPHHPETDDIIGTNHDDHLRTPPRKPGSP